MTSIRSSQYSFEVENISGTIADSDIAVVGMSGRFPGASSIKAFEKLLWEGREGIIRFPPEEADSRLMGDPINEHEDFVPVAAALDDIEMFDAEAFGLSSREAVLLDPQHRILLECAVEALDDAAINPQTFNKKIGVFAGCGISSYLLHELISSALITQADPLEILMGCDKDFISTRISYLLNLTGPSFAVQSACSTSLLAIHMAVQSILLGECDAALAGGATITTPQKMGYIYHSSGIRSPDGHCRPFDVNAAGTVFGSGVGVVLLRPLSAALRDGDPIRAVLRASAVNNDGNAKVGFTAPSVMGQIDVLAEALSLSGLDAEGIGYIEAHGTATPMGDPIEFKALSEVYGCGGKDAPPCLIGSVKSNIGHLDAAAGVAGFIKTVLCLERGTVPPTLHFTHQNPEIDLENSRFRISSQTIEWPISGIRRACVSSFGVGGTNVHIVLEQAPVSSNIVPSTLVECNEALLFPISARSDKALLSTVATLANYIEQEDVSLENMAYTLQKGRQFAPYRKAFAAQAKNIEAKLSSVKKGHKALVNPKIGFLFAGQGSQYPGMSRALAERFIPFRNTLEECISGFYNVAGIELAPLLLDAASDDINATECLRQTAWAQPAIFAHTIACARLWQEFGIKPSIFLGHSIGEWSSAVLSGIVSLEDGIFLVARRATIMQSAPEGAMLAVPLSVHEVQKIITDSIDIAVINGMEHCVLSGLRKDLEIIASRIENTKWLKTSHGFHSRYMSNAALEFAGAVASVQLLAPSIPVISNLTGNIMNIHEVKNPEYWGSLLCKPVQFYKGLQTFLGSVDISIECGSGNGLTGLVMLAASENGHDHCNAVASCPSISESIRLKDSGQRSFFVQSVGSVWESGVNICFDVLHSESDIKPRRIRLPAVCFNRKPYWPKQLIGEIIFFSSKTPQISKSEKDITATTQSKTTLEFMQELWAEILNLQSVNADQTFLELGGTSVIAMQLVARCRQEGFICKSTDILRLQTPRAVVESMEVAQNHTFSDKAFNEYVMKNLNLSDSCLLLVQEGENAIVHIEAGLAVSKEFAKHCGKQIAEHAYIMHKGWKKSWRGVQCIYADLGDTSLVVFETPPQLSPEHGLCCTLSICSSSQDSENCRLTVSLHLAAGSPADASAILCAWARACQGEIPDLNMLETLGKHNHVSLSGYGSTNLTVCGRHTSCLASIPLQEEFILWKIAANDEYGILFCAIATMAGNILYETRVFTRQKHFFGFPKLDNENNIDELLFAFRFSLSPSSEPLLVANGSVCIDWLDDLSLFALDDVNAMLESSTTSRLNSSEGKLAISICLYREQAFLHVASNNETRDSHAIVKRIQDIFYDISTRPPTPSFLIFPEKITKSSIPFNDLKKLHALEISNAV